MRVLSFNYCHTNEQNIGDKLTKFSNSTSLLKFMPCPFVICSHTFTVVRDIDKGSQLLPVFTLLMYPLGYLMCLSCNDSKLNKYILISYQNSSFIFAPFCFHHTLELKLWVTEISVSSITNRMKCNASHFYFLQLEVTDGHVIKWLTRIGIG